MGSSWTCSKEAQRLLRRSNQLGYIEQQLLLTSVDDVARRKDLLRAKDSVEEWGFVRAGLQRPDLHGMDTYEIRALEFLERGGTSPSLLGISGKRGVGKTTLLELIRTTYQQPGSSFSYVFCVEDGGAGFTTDIALDDLAKHIGLDPLSSQAINNVPLAKIVSNFLEDQTFLLLLDDVRQGIDLAAIGLPMPLGHGQKVVFTTRDPAICAEMGCAAGNTIQMQCLGEDAAWNLFRYWVGDEIIRPGSEIEYLAKQIVAGCRGYPSALRTVGGSMSIRRDWNEWMFAYDMIKKGALAKFQEMDDEDYPCLQFF